MFRSITTCQYPPNSANLLTKNITPTLKRIAGGCFTEVRHVSPEPYPAVAQEELNISHPVKETTVHLPLDLQSLGVCFLLDLKVP